MKAADKNRAFDGQFKRVFHILETADIGSDEYKSALDTLDGLLIAKKKVMLIPPETIMTGIVNLVGILMVLNFERLGVITSRAMNFIKKS